MLKSGERLLILGASARAAACSAVRAGVPVASADLFADVDLAALGPTRRIRRYPQEFALVARQMGRGPWLYTGGLENYPELVGRIAAHRPLLGNPPEVLRAVRNPRVLAETLIAAGLRAPAVAEAPQGLSRDGRWLVKPRRGSGGRAIAALLPGTRLGRNSYLQQHVPGSPCAGVFVAASSEIIFLGATRQLIGESWTGATGYQYSGSIGPLPLGPAATQRWRHIGEALAERFRLCGFFGVDAIDDGADLWPVEVNPRHTASLEVLERAAGRSLMPWHLAACYGNPLPRPACLAYDRCYGKAVLFARRPLQIPDGWTGVCHSQRDEDDWPYAADIPAAGETIAPGQPVVTLFAAGAGEVGVREILRQRLERVRQELEPPSA